MAGEIETLPIGGATYHVGTDANNYAIREPAPVSLFKFMTPNQISDVMNRAFAVDTTDALNSAFAAGVPLTSIGGLFRHDGPMTIPKTGLFSLVGSGHYAAEFRAGADMTYSMSRDVVANGADLNPSRIENIYINGNRHSQACLRIGSSKGGKLSNIKTGLFLASGFQFGNDNGSTTAAFYENHISKLTADGGNTYNDATRGAWFKEGSTDNVLDMLVSSYLNTASGIGLDNFGAGNIFGGVHTYGGAYNWRSNIFCQFVNPYADSMSVAGCRINGDGIIVIGGEYYWPVGQTPTIGGAVPIEIDSDAVTVVNLVGGLVRNDNGANPYIRFISPSSAAVKRPARFTALGMTPARAPLTNDPTDTTANEVGRSFSVRSPVNSVDAEVQIEVQATSRAQVVLKKKGIIRYFFGTDATDATGSGDTNENFEINAKKDDNSTFQIFKWFRATKTGYFKDSIVMASTTGKIGFFDVTPQSKQTLAAAATDAATTMALANDMRAKWVLYGLSN